MRIKKVGIITLGCRANQAESIELARRLQERYLVDFGLGDSDIYVLNTCTVTSKADRDVRKFINRILRVLDENGYLIVTGCFVDAYKDKLCIEDKRVLFLNNKEKEKIPSLIDRLVEGEGIKPQLLPLLKARIPILIQRGCIHRCSYCIVPYVRGREEWSMNLEEVKEKVEYWASMGINEIVFTGINLGRWGKSLSPPLSLKDLVEFVEEKTSIYRFRFSSIEPWCITKELIDCLKNSKKFCQHLHIPIQHGTEEILRKMNRPYSPEYIEELFTYLVESIPEITIGSDIIVGFPGEDKELFYRSFEFIKKLPITYLHVFSFSPRRFTKFSDTKVENIDEIKERVRILRELSLTRRKEKGRGLIGKIVEAVIEEKLDGEVWRGTTREYFTVQFRREEGRVGEIVKLKVKDIKENGELSGEVLG